MPGGTAGGNQFKDPTMPALVCYLLGACGEREAGLRWTLAQHCQNPGDYDYKALGEILPSERNLFGQSVVFLLQSRQFFLR